LALAGRTQRIGSLALVAALLCVLAFPARSLASLAPPGSLAWGYEASGDKNARILEYDISTDQFVASCQPPDTNNGRGIAYDPTDGDLWYTRVKYERSVDLSGDGLIHKTTRPPECDAVQTIPFGDGPGGSIQDGIGALDVDSDDGNLWAAGYQPIGNRSFLYKVDRDTGAILASCWTPFGDGGTGNDTLTEAKLSGLPGSGSYLLTDAGEVDTTFNALKVLDEASCTGGGQATQVGTAASHRFTGIDYEIGRLFGTDKFTISEFGDYPFSFAGAAMSSSPSTTVEDIAVRGNRPPDCSSVAATPNSLLPPNHQFESVSLSAPTDPDGDAVTIAIDGVTQDEPVRTLGDNTTPDARRTAAGDQVELRAERNPRRDGRVYRVAFTASDGNGGSCSGSVNVSVPRRQADVAVDSSPPSYGSFGP
jgi:hypothetical protein